ncbi:MAG: ATP synthase F1 subunit gamma [Firmicutes bacterium]|nr:ATP synthase F1 subunit gamma [Bacillota bacterium]
MPGVRDIRRRIKAVRNTQQITKAMKMVAAAKLLKAQARVTAARPYAGKLREVLGRVVTGEEQAVHPLLAPREIRRVTIVAFTSDRGLAGSYNVNVVRRTLSALDETRGAGREPSVIAVGRKGIAALSRRGAPISVQIPGLREEADLELARDLVGRLRKAYLDGETDEVVLIYTRFFSALTQRVVTSRLLPITQDLVAAAQEGTNGKGSEAPRSPAAGGEGEYIYEPSPEGVLEILLARYLEVQIYHAIIEAKASEHGARMTAMENATNNATDMIDRLTLEFNKARQAAITREVSEIVGGAEALKG